MKKLLSVLLAICLIFSCAECVFAKGVDIMADSSWSVLVSASASARDAYAADTLAKNLSKVFGAQIPVTTTASGKYFAVGEAADCDVSGVADNGYRITVKDANVLIRGTGTRGTLFGVYRFLEDFCGMKVYTSRLTVLPEADTIAIPEDTDIVYAPYFEYTDTDWRSPHDPVYSLANGLTGGTYRSLSSEQGGTVNYISNFCHTLTTQFCTSAKYFETHPEYFAYRIDEGKRVDKQLCLTNPEVVQIVTQEVLDLLAEKHDPTASLQIVSLTQNDNYTYCECDNCRAFEAAHGDVRSATMINFVNQVADAVAAKGYDNVAIDTFAYQYTRQAPTGIAPRDNMIVRLCTIECCFSHALNDPTCERNVALMKDLEDWSKICGRIYVWDYTTNYAHTCCIFPDFGVIQKNAQVFYEHNVKGVYEEGNYYIESCDTELGELRSYMLAKVLQDPYCDLDAEVNGFLDAYYGPGGKYIGKALDLYTLHAGDKDGHLGIYQGTAENFTLNNYHVAMIDGYWKAAMDAAETDEQRTNIERSETGWLYWKAHAKKGEFSLTNPDRFNENQKLMDRLIKFNVHMLHEGDTADDYRDCISARYVVPDEWNMYEADEIGAKTRNFFAGILEKLMPLLTGFGFLYKLFRAIGTIDFKLPEQYC